jgi:hypothetical protein
MTWAEVVVLWVTLSVTLPVLLGLRYTRLRETQSRLNFARAHYHRFHVRHRSSLGRWSAE